jgi:hypothetical protein
MRTSTASTPEVRTGRRRSAEARYGETMSMDAVPPTPVKPARQ